MQDKSLDSKKDQNLFETNETIDNFFIIDESLNLNNPVLVGTRKEDRDDPTKKGDLEQAKTILNNNFNDQEITNYWINIIAPFFTDAKREFSKRMDQSYEFSHPLGVSLLSKRLGGKILEINRGLAHDIPEEFSKNPEHLNELLYELSAPFGPQFRQDLISLTNITGMLLKFNKHSPGNEKQTIKKLETMTAQYSSDKEVSDLIISPTEYAIEALEEKMHREKQPRNYVKLKIYEDPYLKIITDRKTPDCVRIVKLSDSMRNLSTLKETKITHKQSTVEKSIMLFNYFKIFQKSLEPSEDNNDALKLGMRNLVYLLGRSVNMINPEKSDPNYDYLKENFDYLKGAIYRSGGDYRKVIEGETR